VQSKWKIVSIKEELGVISGLEKGEGIVDVCHNVRLADSSVHTICDHADRINLLKPNDIYICRTAALTSRRYILNIYSKNIRTEYFKHAA